MTETENYERFRLEYMTKKETLDEEARAKNEELTQMAERIAELTKQIEREH